jgi:hypothetical protein
MSSRNLKEELGSRPENEGFTDSSNDYLKQKESPQSLWNSRGDSNTISVTLEDSDTYSRILDDALKFGARQKNQGDNYEGTSLNFLQRESDLSLTEINDCLNEINQGNRSISTETEKKASRAVRPLSYPLPSLRGTNVDQESYRIKIAQFENQFLPPNSSIENEEKSNLSTNIFSKATDGEFMFSSNMQHSSNLPVKPVSGTTNSANQVVVTNTS